MDWAKGRYRLSAKQSRQRRCGPPAEALLDSSNSSEPGIESIKAVETGIVTGRELPFKQAESLAPALVRPRDPVIAAPGDGGLRHRPTGSVQAGQKRRR